MRDTEVVDSFYAGLSWLGRALFSIGGLGFLIGMGFLIMYVFKFAGGDSVTPQETAQATELITKFGGLALFSGAACVLGAIIIFWGEEVLSPVLIIVSGGVFFAPNYMPMMMGGNSSALSTMAIQKIQTAGGVIGIISIVALAGDVAIRVRDRVKMGARADTLKYGKGMKQEQDFQNVMLGRCWQMPYCRKFVREKCPIYHAKTTCWKERVGCMCEEKVIQNALVGATIPKDSLSASKMIPYNKELPMSVKIERCRQCVIYNERQRQKYKIAMPVVVLGCAVLYVLLRGPLTEFLSRWAVGADKFLGTATMNAHNSVDRADQMGILMFREILAVCLILMLMAYLLKVAEFVFFKLKL